jgi:hypothetical protein
MSFRECLLGTIGRSHTRRKEAEGLLERFDARVVDLRRTGATESRAEAEASQEFTEEVAENVGWKKTARMRDAQVQLEQLARLNKAKDPLKELTKIYVEIDNKSDGYLGHFHSYLSNFLDEYEGRVLGAFRKEAGLDDIAEEMYGNNSGSASAKGFAAAIKNLNEMYGKSIRALGVNRVDDPNYHMPQRHHVGKMKKAGMEVWVNHHLAEHKGEPVLDWELMKGWNDGKAIAPDDRRGVLQKVYDTITTRGLSKVTPDRGAGDTLVSRLTHKRFLRYTSASTWGEMNNKYGDGTLADQLIANMVSSSKDLGLLQTMGPNPTMTKRRLENEAIRLQTLKATSGSAKMFPKLMDKIGRSIDSADDIYGEVTNRGSAIDDNWVAVTGATIRTVLTGAFLGRTVLTAGPTDAFKMNHVAYFAKHRFMEPVRATLNLLNPASRADRAFAKQSGVIMEQATANMAAGLRYGGDLRGQKWSRVFTEGALRMTGLTQWTEKARWATRMELMGDFARNARKDFDSLPFRARFERANISREDWDLFRSTALADRDGAKFLRPGDLMRRTDIDAAKQNDTFAKISAYMQDFQEEAVPSGSVESRVFLVGDTRRGGWPGEFNRSIAMFKSFPITIMMKTWAEGMAQATGPQKAAYVASMVAGMTVAGAAAEQFNAVSKGLHPRNMNDGAFWLRALARGGGASLWGDFIASDHNRYGQRFFQQLIGAPVGALDDASKLTAGNLQKLVSAAYERGVDGMIDAAENMTLLSDFVNAARKYTPGSHVWYYDLALKSLLGEHVLQHIDPKFHEKARNAIDRAWKQGEGEYWWSPGSATPDSAPDISRMWQ